MLPTRPPYQEHRSRCLRHFTLAESESESQLRLKPVAHALRGRANGSQPGNLVRVLAGREVGRAGNGRYRCRLVLKARAELEFIMRSRQVPRAPYSRRCGRGRN